MDECSYDAPILRSEFYVSLRDLKNKKAPGINEIPGELRQNASESIMDTMYYLIKYLYETRVIQKDFCNGIIVTLPKINKADFCTDFRTLSLLPRLKDTHKNYISKDI